MSEELRRSGAQTREELLDEYGLRVSEVETDSEGRRLVVWSSERVPVRSESGREMMFALRPECERLLLDTLREVADGLKEYSRRGVQDDDDTDYIQALSDQASVLTDMLTFSSLTVEPSAIEDRVLKILNATYEETIDPNNASEDLQAFILGYADHYTPISAMMRDPDDE